MITEWEKLDNDFNNLLLRAYHFWLVREQCQNELGKESANFFIDKYMKEAHNIRSQSVTAKVEF